MPLFHSMRLNPFVNPIGDATCSRRGGALRIPEMFKLLIVVSALCAPFVSVGSAQALPAAGCAAGQDVPDGSEKADFRAKAVVVRHTAEAGIQEAADYPHVRKALKALVTAAIAANAASYDPNLTCQDLVDAKGDVSQKWDDVLEEAGDLDDDERERVLGELPSAMEDFLGSGGTPTFLGGG